MMFSRKAIYALVLPLMVEQLLGVTIGMADTVMVSSCGEAAVSGVSLVDSINILLIQIFAAMATGGAIVSAQYLGRQNREKANLSAKQLFFIVAVLSCFIMLLCLALNNPLLHLIFGSAEESVMANCETYFFWSALSYPFIGLYNAGAALFRSMNNSKVSMLTSLGMNTINVSGNALLIFGFQMGVAGAAIATLVSRVVGAAVMLLLLLRPHNVIYIDTFRRFRPDWRMVRTILAIGIPSGLENGMFQIGKILVQGLVASLGTIAIASNAVAGSVAGIPQIPGAAIGLGLITIVGRCVGANEYEQARKYIIRLTGLAYVAMAVLSAGLILAARPVIQCYGLLGETSDLAFELLVANCLASIVLWPASFVLPNGLRAANDVKFTMTVSVLSMWIFRIGFSYLLVYGFQMGVLGVWVAMFIDWGVRIIAFVARFLSGKWTAKKLAD